MRRSHASRCAAILMTMLFAFQLLVVGSGMECTVPDAAVAGDMSRAATGVVMTGGRSARAVAAAMPAHAADASHQMPCHQRMDPPLCQAMGPCVTSVAAPPVTRPIGQHILPSRIAAMVVLTPPSRTLRPELPPPRA